MNTRITLGQSDFGRLVCGLPVERHGVAIVLADIGFLSMANELDKAIHGFVPETEPEAVSREGEPVC